MKKVQQFIYHGIPKAQGRPRFARRGKFVTAYDPKESRAYKNNFAAQIIMQNPVMALPGVPVNMNLKIILPRPKYHYNSKGEVKERFVNAAHVVKPDLDNLEKAIKDSLKGIVWHDDCQVCSVTKNKIYGNNPKVLITVESEV